MTPPKCYAPKRLDAPPDQWLSRKEIAAVFQRDRITVYRWECEGLRLRDGRATEMQVAWFLELRDAARVLGLPTLSLVGLCRQDQELHLAAAHAIRCARRATSCNKPGQDNAPASR